MGKKDRDRTVTQTTTLPPHIQEAQEALFGRTGELIEYGLDNPGSRVSPFTDHHNAAFGMLSQTAGLMDLPTADYSHTIAGTRYDPNTAGYGQAAEMAAGAATPTQITSEDITSQMNPYTDMVVDRAMSGMRDRFDEARTDLKSNMAARQAFGDSGRGALEAELADNYIKGATETEAGLRSAAYDKASSLASQNAQLQEAGRGRELGAAQLAMQGVSGENAARLGAANFDVSAASSANDVLGDVFNRRLQAGQTVAGVGDVLRGYDQQLLDEPHNLLNWGANIIPGTTGSTSTTTQPMYSNPTSTLLGAGLMAGRAFNWF
ncbi:hypothetical protein [Roseibium sp.]|uniref:hypothetical protein n=1 Tax=Roseibium sp. TaxID=1936156 RepID=UPI003B521EED